MLGAPKKRAGLPALSAPCASRTRSNALCVHCEPEPRKLSGAARFAAIERQPPQAETNKGQ